MADTLKIIVSIACVLSGVLLLLFAFHIQKLEAEIAVLRTVRQLETTLPVGTKFYYDAWTGRECVRCGNGRIALRERYQTSYGEDGELVLDVLPRIHWCTNCNYRNTSLELEKKTNLT